MRTFASPQKLEMPHRIEIATEKSFRYLPSFLIFISLRNDT